MTADTNFLQELKEQYDKEFDKKSWIENKSSYLITVAGLVVPLLFGFGTTLIEKIQVSYVFFWPISIIVMAGIVLNLLSVLYSVMSFRVMLYSFAMGHDIFYDNKGKPDTKTINDYKSLKPKEFEDKMIDVYLRCNKHNSEMNLKKAEYIQMSQWLFLAGIGIIPISLLLLFSNIPSFLK